MQKINSEKKWTSFSLINFLLAPNQERQNNPEMNARESTSSSSDTCSASGSSSSRNVRKKPEHDCAKNQVELNLSMRNCQFCLQSQAMEKHMLISMRENFYLILPAETPITEGHCMLVPLRHVPCAAQLEEKEFKELLVFQNRLTKMFDAVMKKDVIFFETAIFQQGYPHMQIHCVPLTHAKSILAPHVFNKVFSNFGRKLTSLNGRDVRAGIPKGKDYFNVSFGMFAGYAHVIEDDKFPKNFAEIIFESLLDLSRCRWKGWWRQNIDKQCERVLVFSRNWCSYNPATSY